MSQSKKEQAVSFLIMALPVSWEEAIALYEGLECAGRLDETVEKLRVHLLAQATRPLANKPLAN